MPVVIPARCCVERKKKYEKINLNEGALFSLGRLIVTHSLLNLKEIIPRE